METVKQYSKKINLWGFLVDFVVVVGKAGWFFDSRNVAEWLWRLFSQGAHLLYFSICAFYAHFVRKGMKRSLRKPWKPYSWYHIHKCKHIFNFFMPFKFLVSPLRKAITLKVPTLYYSPSNRPKCQHLFH